eukprot:12452010-Prorocentrum_lima.AAC.1
MPPCIEVFPVYDRRSVGHGGDALHVRGPQLTTLTTSYMALKHVRRHGGVALRVGVTGATLWISMAQRA